MATSARKLLDRIRSAQGGDAHLDEAIARELDPTPVGRSIPDYTTSVENCLALIARVLPGWRWHVGYGPTGVLPYASVSKSPVRFEASAPTVPLALLAAMLKAKISEEDVRKPR